MCLFNGVIIWGKSNKNPLLVLRLPSKAMSSPSKSSLLLFLPFPISLPTFPRLLSLSILPSPLPCIFLLHFTPLSPPPTSSWIPWAPSIHRYIISRLGSSSLCLPSLPSPNRLNTDITRWRSVDERDGYRGAITSDYWLDTKDYKDWRWRLYSQKLDTTSKPCLVEGIDWVNGFWWMKCDD